MPMQSNTHQPPAPALGVLWPCCFPSLMYLIAQYRDLVSGYDSALSRLSRYLSAPASRTLELVINSTTRGVARFSVRVNECGGKLVVMFRPGRQAATPVSQNGCSRHRFTFAVYASDRPSAAMVVSAWRRVDIKATAPFARNSQVLDVMSRIRGRRQNNHTGVRD